MNNQVNHIFYAIINLVISAALYSFLSKIPKDLIFPETKNEFDYGTGDKKKPLTENAEWGKMIFNSKCASCHSIFKDCGPSLLTAMNSGRWDDKQKLLEWIKNPTEFMKTDEYTRELKKKYGSTMIAFPDITFQEVDAIAEYINFYTPY